MTDVSFAPVGSQIQYFDSNNDRALRSDVKGRTVYWLCQDGDGVAIMSTRVYQEVFEMPRFPIISAKKFGATIEAITNTVQVTENATVDAAEWPDGTIGVMFIKERT